MRDSRIDTLGEAPKSVVYYPFAQRPRRLTVIARTAGDPAVIAPTIRAAVNAIDASAKIDVSTLREAASMELNMRRVGTQMTGVIGLVGMLLTTIGLYGIVSVPGRVQDARARHPHGPRRHLGAAIPRSP